MLQLNAQLSTPGWGVTTGKRLKLKGIDGVPAHKRWEACEFNSKATPEEPYQRLAHPLTHFWRTWTLFPLRRTK
ncbi:hypothetical protein B0X16_01400 [Listeria monocytogenes]|nr:hypothetical protein B0X16_01400 [Listeria monocytogenes]